MFHVEHLPFPIHQEPAPRPGRILRKIVEIGIDPELTLQGPIRVSGSTTGLRRSLRAACSRPGRCTVRARPSRTGRTPTYRAAALSAGREGGFLATPTWPHPLAVGDGERSSSWLEPKYRCPGRPDGRATHRIYSGDPAGRRWPPGPAVRRPPRHSAPVEPVGPPRRSPVGLDDTWVSPDRGDRSPARVRRLRNWRGADQRERRRSRPGVECAPDPEGSLGSGEEGLGRGDPADRRLTRSRPCRKIFPTPTPLLRNR